MEPYNITVRQKLSRAKKNKEWGKQVMKELEGIINNESYH